jgi:hypothetical protein
VPARNQPRDLVDDLSIDRNAGLRIEDEHARRYTLLYMCISTLIHMAQLRQLDGSVVICVGATSVATIFKSRG